MNFNQLCEIRDKQKKVLNMRYKSKDPKNENIEIVLCGGTGCTSGKSFVVKNIIEQLIKKHKLNGKVKVTATGCFGYCAKGPFLIFYPKGTTYSLVKPENAEKIFTEEVLNNQHMTELVCSETKQEGNFLELFETNFFKKQVRVALRNCSKIDPYNINDYIAMDGYFALCKCLQEFSPEKVIEIIKASNLKGRGGAGFPTGIKWEIAAKASSNEKYIICNGDEGDPGAYMDRSILEGDPHSILEAMAIAGYAVNASKGFIYVRAEYPIHDRIENAIKQAKAYNLLGKNILGSNFNFDVEIRLGSGAFVCGEETALIASIEGGRGRPKTKPPFPAVCGLFGKPTIINNVETLANINPIILKGADWFNSIGTPTAKGTKVFALSGKVKNMGLIEVPFGTTLREIIFDIGGGILNDKAFKAAQIGGPSGGCIPAKYLDMPIDYDHLKNIGTMVGSGGLIVLDEDTCMVDLTKYYLNFTLEESCGKCTPCRIGNKLLHDMIEKVSGGKAELSDLEWLKNKANYIKENSLCGLGKTAPNPLLSTMQYFEEEYKEHVVNKKCPALVCRDLITFKIEDNCKKCGICFRVCPVNAIVGDRNVGYTIIQEKCVKCGLCKKSCPFNAISKK